MFESIYKRVDKPIDNLYYESGAGFVIPDHVKDRTFELSFREKLRKAGLQEFAIDLLVLRFVYAMSIRDISEELSVVSSSTALRILQESLTYLRKKGFGK